ncbi:uncharacterized protein LOC123541075 isoform X2 [Mercenaria mercenaria]|nr:uncharacterized protein LOC123541075 isoform X2 [Mercenaria mercenaria]
MQDRQQCPLCLRAGLVKYLQSYQINLEEAIVLCENKLCTYPLSQSSSVTTTFSRSLDDVISSRANEEKVQVPDAQLALQTKVASHMRKTGLRLQKDAIGIQTGSPQLKKKLKSHRLPHKKRGITPVLLKQASSDNYHHPLKLQNSSRSFPNFKSFTENSRNIPGATDCKSWTSCNGSEGGSDKDSLLNSSVDSLESTSSASSNSSIGDSLNFSKQVTASYPAFQLGEGKTRNLPKSLPSFKSISSQPTQLNGQSVKENHKLPEAVENVPLKTEDINPVSVPKDCEVNVNELHVPKLNVINRSPSISQGDSSLLVCKDNCDPLSKDRLVNKETLGKLQNCLSKNAVIGNSTSVIGNSNTVIGNRTGVIENSADVEKRENLLRYPYVFPQWRNKDALCWLDVILCLVVHNETLKSYIFRDSCDKEKFIHKLFKAHNQACIMIQVSQMNQTEHSPVVGMEQHTSKIDEHSVSTVNQVHQSNGVSKENIVISNAGGNGTCLDNSTSVETLLNEVRDEVWTKLQSKLKCEKGQHESPVFAFPLVLKEDQGVEEKFRMTYRFEYECSQCGKVEKTDHTNTLPTFPAVIQNFNIGDPQHRKTCPQCGNTADSRTMVYKKLPECLLMHFVEGLPETTWRELQFGFHGYLYTVTGVVQYVNNPNHFIAWLRNPNDNKWFKCDDLRPTVCRKRINEPKFPCKEIHIVMWERLQLKSRICRQVAMDIDSPLRQQELEKNLSLVCSSGSKLKLSANESDTASKQVDILSENTMSNDKTIDTKVKCISLNSIQALDTSPCSTRSTESSDSLLLPNFIASTPVSESVLRPIPVPIVSVLPLKSDRNDVCIRNDLPVQEKTEHVDRSESENSETTGLNKELKVKNPDVIEHLKAMIESRISVGVKDDPNEQTERNCQSDLPCSQISGPKSLIKPSTVFCVPKKSSDLGKISLSSGVMAAHCNGAVKNETVYQNVFSKSKEKGTECDSGVKENELKDASNKTMAEIELPSKQGEKMEEKDSKNEVEKNTDIIKESDKKKTTKGRTSSSRLSHSSRFKVPFSYNKKPHISRDAFFTLQTDKSSPCSSGESTPLSISASSSPSLSGNLTYLSSVKQYLLSRTTGRTDPKFKFEGLNLKSVSSRSSSFNFSEFYLPVSSHTSSNGSEIPEVSNSSSDNMEDSQSMSDTSSQSSIISRKSALVNKLIEKLEQSPVGGTGNHTTLKRKLENNTSKNTKKKVSGDTNKWDKMSNGNTSLKENSRFPHRKKMPGGKSMKLVRNLVNAAEQANIMQEKKTKYDEGSTELSDNMVKANETKCDSESVLQDLYEALNLPFSNVNAAMSDIMTDVDDILDFVNVGDVVPDEHQSDRPLSCLGGSIAGNQKHSD